MPETKSRAPQRFEPAGRADAGSALEIGLAKPHSALELTRRDLLRRLGYGATASVLTACGGFGTSPASPPAASPAAPASTVSPSVVTREPIKLQLPYSVPATSPLGQTFNEFAKAVGERTNGEVSIETFPSASLGNQTEILAAISLGAPIIGGFSPAEGAPHVPDLAAVEAPFLFANRQETLKVLNSGVFDDLVEQLGKKKNWWFISRNWTNGPRHLYNRVRAIRVPGDLKGLKIRVPPIPLYNDLFAALGATPTPLSFTEMYTGIEQGLIDGMENPVFVAVDLKIYEVAKHMSLTSHIYQAPGMIGGKFYNALPEDVKRVISEESTRFGDVFWERTEAQYNKGLETLRAGGMTITEIDRKAFVDAAQPVYEAFEKKWSPGLVGRLIAARDK